MFVLSTLAIHFCREDFFPYRERSFGAGLKIENFPMWVTGAFHLLSKNSLPNKIQVPDPLENKFILPFHKKGVKKGFALFRGSLSESIRCKKDSPVLEAF